MTTTKLKIAPIATPYDSQLANAKASVLSTQAMRTAANQSTSADINAQLGASNASSKAEQSQFTSLADHAAALAQAVGSFGPQYGQAGGDAYNQAANTIAQLGTGLTGAAGADWQAQDDAANASVQKVLGPSAQIQTYDPKQLQSAAQYLGVTQPGTTLAQQALNERNLQIYGNQANMAQVKTISDQYIAQAAQALQQRAAERATIIAQRPELFQQALAAQKADNIQTQNHIDSLVTASQNWLQNQQKEKDSQAATKFSENASTTAANRSYALSHAALYHTDANGNPLPGYVNVKLPDGTSTIVPYQTAAAVKQGWASINANKQTRAEQVREFNQTLKVNQTRANAALTAAKAKGETPAGYDSTLSKQVGYLIDKNRNPILDTKGNRIPWKQTSTASKSAGFTDSLVSQAADSVAQWKTGQTGTANGQPVIGDTPKTWEQAMQGALALGPNTPAWKSRATAIVNAAYGTPQSIALAAAQHSKNQNVGLTDTIKGYLSSVLTNTAAVPAQYFVQAVAQAYGQKPEGVRAIFTQLQELVQNGQLILDPKTNQIVPASG